MGHETNYLIYCPIASDDKDIRSVISHELIYPHLEDSIDKNRESGKEPYCKFCGKTKSILEKDYADHQRELTEECRKKGYQSGLMH